MTTGTEALVRRAYHFAEGDVLDAQGFIGLFAEDGVFNGIGGVSGQESYRGEQLGDVVVFMGRFLPDVHRELHRVNVLGDVVAIELSIRGHLPRPVRDTRRRDPADGSQARHPDRRLLVCARRQDPGVQLLRQHQLDARADRCAAGLRLRRRGTRVNGVAPTRQVPKSSIAVGSCGARRPTRIRWTASGRCPKSAHGLWTVVIAYDG